jgi:hypothetical protein
VNSSQAGNRRSTANGDFLMSASERQRQRDAEMALRDELDKKTKMVGRCTYGEHSHNTVLEKLARSRGDWTQGQVGEKIDIWAMACLYGSQGEPCKEFLFFLYISVCCQTVTHRQAVVQVRCSTSTRYWPTPSAIYMRRRSICIYTCVAVYMRCTFAFIHASLFHLCYTFVTVYMRYTFAFIHATPFHLRLCMHHRSICVVKQR